MTQIAPRQAVVIIHGIGEQVPMQTLRGFVKAVTAAAGLGDFVQTAASKPDYISPTLELRRMAVPGDAREWSPGDWVSTDFYELYWAHLMAGTTWQQVSAWAGRLLLRRPSSVPPRLKSAWWIGWALVLAAVVVLLGPTGPDSTAEWSLTGVLIALALAACRLTGNYFGLQYAGDAARYLSATPENVGVRKDIRAAAIELLEGLHDDPAWRRYHRVIVVGHSLGSVIAYDALTHLWQRRHHPHETYPPDTGTRAGEPGTMPVSPGLSIPAARDAQSAMWRRQRSMGVQWKITDLVTLGSPLAHAPFLMADNRRDFVERVRQREYPTCPPQPDDRRDQQYGVSLLTPPGAAAAVAGASLLHHAALFACTRWTNLYFEKDIIGGPIADLGQWIRNERLADAGTFPHTRYWSEGTDHALLAQALDLRHWWTDPANLAAAIAAQDRESGQPSHA